MNCQEDTLALFLQIQKAYLRCCYDAVRDEPIKMTEMMCILFLYENAPHDTSNEIAKRYMLSRSLVSKTVDSLKTAGYLETERDDIDSRKIHLHLTDKCQPMLQRLQNAREKFFSDVLKGVSERETIQMEALAQKLQRNLNGMQNAHSSKKSIAIHIKPDVDAYFDWTMKG
jgi:DNA-binding MarR family transcriptional regulator